MKESVSRTSHPWLVGAAVLAIGAGYFYAMGKGDYPEPGANLNYDITEYKDLDNIETRYDELDALDPKMDDPSAMAVRDEFIYVSGENAIAKFDGADREVARFEIEGTPNSLFVAQDGTIFATFSDRVQVFDADGERSAEWEPFNERSYLTAIAVHEENVFVADAANRLVLRYDREGNLKTRIGAKDTKRDIPGIEVPSPYLDLAINDEGHLWVVNPGELGLERYREDGDIVTSWYQPNLRLEGFSGCCNPTQIAFTPEGKLITAEKGLVRIKSYEVTMGKYEELIAGSRLFPKEASLRDIAVDAKGRILALDPRSDTVRIFALKAGSQEESDGSETKPA